MMAGKRHHRDSGRFARLLLLAAMTFAAGCSSANTSGTAGAPTANHIDASGESVAGWLAQPSGGDHAASATLNFESSGDMAACAECHGQDLRGGASRVSCFGCHHASDTWAVPSPGAQEHGTAAKAGADYPGFVSCRICHGEDFSGGGSSVSCFSCHDSAPHPSTWNGTPYTHVDTDPSNARVCATCHLNSSAPAGASPGCFNNTLCHGSVVHAVPFNDNAHYGVTDSSFAADCGACHGIASDGRGPACSTCHAAGSPLSALNCTSCHSAPPDGSAPAGAEYPNIPGKHSAHGALGSTGGSVGCNDCHNGLGTGTLAHYNNAKSRTSPGNAAFRAAFNSKTGTASFDNSALTCSNVSCHGGQTTPDWRTGTIDVDNDCTACHALTNQYNSYYSGDHEAHLAVLPVASTTCRYCHNTVALAATHFVALDTTAMEGPASATIGGTGTLVDTYDPGTGSCWPKAGPGCHGQRSW